LRPPLGLASGGVAGGSLRPGGVAGYAPSLF